MVGLAKLGLGLGLGDIQDGYITIDPNFYPSCSVPGMNCNDNLLTNTSLAQAEAIRNTSLNNLPLRANEPFIFTDTYGNSVAKAFNATQSLSASTLWMLGAGAILLLVGISKG